MVVFDYWINVESDMILPDDTFEKLTALIFEHGADIGTGHYVFRNWRKPGVKVRAHRMSLRACVMNRVA